MRFKVSFVAMAVMALVSVGFAQGQGQGGGRRQGGMMGGMQRGGGQRLTGLLRSTQVQEELKITDEQKAKIEELPGARGGRGAGGGGGNGGGGNGGGGNGGGGGQRFTPPTPEEQAKQFAEDKKAVEAILTPEQAKRLYELRVQWAGPSAILLPDVQEAIGFTAAQKASVADLQKKMNEANTGLMEKMRNQEIDRQDGMATLMKNNETLRTELAKIPTAEQTAKLKAMGGTELKQEMPQGRRPGGRQG